MGRLGFRAAWGCEELEFVHINEIAGDVTCSAHLLKFDSVHGRWGHDCSAEGGNIIVDGQALSYSMKKNIGDTDWSGCHIVIESSGKLRTKKALQAYYDQGVKKMVVAAPVKEGAHRYSLSLRVNLTVWQCVCHS